MEKVNRERIRKVDAHMPGQPVLGRLVHRQRIQESRGKHRDRFGRLKIVQDPRHHDRSGAAENRLFVLDVMNEIGQSPDHAFKERMSGCRRHQCVAQQIGNSMMPTVLGWFHPDDAVSIVEQQIERLQTNEVQIHIHASVPMKNEIPNGIGALDGRWIAIIRLQEPSVFLRDQFAVVLVSPQSKLPVRMVRPPRLDTFREVLRNVFVFPRLMQDFRNAHRLAIVTRINLPTERQSFPRRACIAPTSLRPHVANQTAPSVQSPFETVLREGQAE